MVDCRDLAGAGLAHRERRRNPRTGFPHDHAGEVVAINFIDVCGAPASGKSTLLDADWPPRCIVPDGRPYPDEWRDFLDVAWRLLDEVSGHPSHSACKSMMARSFRKMATVHRTPGERTYIQTGLAQRGLGLGWRHHDPEAVRPYYEAMPVSLGVVLLKAPADILERRNIERGKDRSHMVPAMVRPLEIAEEVLKKRGVPVAVIDTTRTREKSRAKLLEFVHGVGAKL